MSLQSFRVHLIKKFIDLNEKLIFERKLIKFYRSQFSTPCRSVIDVGANKGQSIDFFLKLNPACEITALEPNPVLFRLLQKKYARYKNIRLFNLGISDHSGEKIFYENVFDYTSSFEELNPQSEYLHRKARILGVKPENIVRDQYPVNVITLKDFIEDHIPDKHADILKIDTEGHEYYCLKGLFDHNPGHHINFIQIENHNDDMYRNRISYQRIKELLEKNNFHERKVISHGYSNLDEVVFQRK